MTINHTHDHRDGQTDAIEEEYLRSKRISPDWRHLGKLGLFLFGLPAMILAPSIIVYLLIPFPKYSLLAMKHQPFGWMEFIRYSILLAGIAFVFILSKIVLELSTGAMVGIVELVKGKTAISLRRQTLFLRGSAFWFSLCMVLIGGIILGSMLLFESSLVEHIGESMKNVKQLDKGAVIQSYFTVERLLLFAVIVTFLFGVARYLVEMISYYFHLHSLAGRIVCCNRQFDILQRLYLSAGRGMIKWKDILTRPLGQGYRKGSGGRFNLLEDAHGLGLSSPRRADELGNITFKQLLPSSAGGRKFLIRDDFAAHLDSGKVEFAMALFDPKHTGQVSLEDFRQTIMAIMEERATLLKAIECNGRIVRKLSTVFTVVTWVISALFGCIVFHLNETAIIVVMGSIYSGLSFAMRSSMKSIYDAINFIFVQHVMDVGDRVVIDGNSMVVDQIDLFVTQFIKSDGCLVLMDNGVLSGKTIYNARRAAPTVHAVEITVSVDTTMEQVRELQLKLEEYCQNPINSALFSGVVEQTAIDLLPGKKLKLVFWVQLAISPQLMAEMNKAKRIINEQVASMLMALQIEKA